VFTLPQQIGGLALQNAREIYNILFRAAAETLLTIAADPKRLGAAVGFLAILHTWGQNLHLHPHLHCVVPGGGIGPDGAKWVGCRKQSFFLPVQVSVPNAGIIASSSAPETRWAWEPSSRETQTSDLASGPSAKA
jgi:hypothetical protein